MSTPDAVQPQPTAEASQTSSTTPTPETPKPEQTEVEPLKPLIGTTEENKDGDPPKEAEPEKKDESKDPPAALTVEDIVLPDGFEMDPKMAETAITLLNDDKLSRKELLQKLVDLQISSVREASEKGSTEWNKMMETWQSQMKDDPEVGGPKFESNLASVNRLVDRFGTPELKAYLHHYGVGNNVEFFRLLSRIAPLVTEPTNVVTGGASNPTPKYTKDNLFPDQGAKA